MVQFVVLPREMAPLGLSLVNLQLTPPIVTRRCDQHVFGLFKNNVLTY